MTAEQKLEAVKAEIEKRMKILWDKLPNASNVEKNVYSTLDINNTVKYTTLEELQDFITSLDEQSEEDEYEHKFRIFKEKCDNMSQEELLNKLNNIEINATIEDALYFIKQYQMSNRCRTESDMQNATTCINWLKSLKQQSEEKQGEQKPAWSEEDEKMFRGSCCYLNEFGNWLSSKNEEKSLSVYKVCDWLKALKERLQSKQEQSDNCDTTNDKDLTKRNEEKAFELSSTHIYGFSVGESNAAYNAALEMAEWKDRQFCARINKDYTYGYNDAVENACEWLRRTQPQTTFPNTTLERFKQAMEEEQ